MLKPEEAKARLKQFEVEHWSDERLTLVRKLRGRAHDVAAAVAFQGDPVDAMLGNREQHEKALAVLGELSAEDRGALFGALWPRLAGAVEQGWQLLGQGVYTTGWRRGSFRAPHAPELHAEERLNWLVALAIVTEDYQPDAPWLATWAAYLPGAATRDLVIGTVLAGAIEAGGPAADEVLQILIGSANGEHEIGGMGEHVIRALATCSRPEAWEYLGKLLLAAQREEGLRQSILERVDEGHPGCFRHLLRLILDHGLARFSAVIRAADVWFGFGYEALAQRQVEHAIERTLIFLEDESAREAALAGAEPTDFHLALWALAFGDAVAATERARAYLSDPAVEKRFVAVKLLQSVGLSVAVQALIEALSDEDLRVAATAAEAILGETEDLAETDLFERLEALVPRLPAKETSLPALVYPWWEVEALSSYAASALIECRGDRPFERLLPMVPHLTPDLRRQLVREVKQAEVARAPVRGFLLELLGDASVDVRRAAQDKLKNARIEPDEAEPIERLLSRKSTDVRRAGLQLLLSQADDAALASAERLTAAKNALQRLAGLELLRELAAADRRAAQCRAVAATYRAAHPRPTADEQVHLDQLAGPAAEDLGPANGFGLFDAASLTPGVAPEQVLSTVVTPAARGLVASLLAKLAEHAATEIEYETYEGPQRGPLSQAYPDHRHPEQLPPGQRTPDKLPLSEVWLEWYELRPADLREADGLELARAWWLGRFLTTARPFTNVWREWMEGFSTAALEADDLEMERELFQARPLAPQASADAPARHWLAQWLDDLVGPPPPGFEESARWLDAVLSWLMVLSPPPAEAAAQWLLDAAETGLHSAPARTRQPTRSEWGFWQNAPINQVREPLFTPCAAHRRLHPAAWSADRRRRVFQLQVWLGEPQPPGDEASAPAPPGRAGKLLTGLVQRVNATAEKPPELRRQRPDFGDAVAAFDVDALSDADLLDYLVGEDHGPLPWLGSCTQRNLPDELASPRLRALVERVCDHLLSIELVRGDRPTPATPYVQQINTVYGAPRLVSLLSSLGKDGFRRATWGDESKGGVLSGVSRGCFPAPTDTPESAAALLRAAKLPDQLLCDAALLAPQWAAHLGAALGWEGFESGVWWLYAHTKDDRWDVADDMREAWSAKVTEHTPLSSQDLLDGAVDVAWFRQVHQTLGEQRFKHLYDAAKFGSSGTGHARARLFADAMLGRLTAADLTARVTDKRHQDSLRALGLVPLPAGEAGEAEVLSRYQVVAELQRTSREFGAQRRESEQRACAVALDNLARTACYPDPIRLQWAMEGRAVADLKAGPVVVAAGEVTVALSISAAGRPELTATKGGKTLKSVPSASGKDPAVAALRARKTGLDHAASRMKGALEQSMCRGDVFRGRELGELLDHPLLAPSLVNLVWLGEGLAGYPAEGGRALRSHAGTLQPLGRDEPVRLAHPVDLLAGGEWHLWQHECFADERVQPFKQVFRELYPLTETERAEGTCTRRYAGHQVQPRQALALLGGRGWVHDPESGLRRTWHEAGLSAWLEFAEPFWTPAEVEGLTLETVRFSRRGEWQPVNLAEVPPVIFSEAMRDLDLVVSVAHRGGVDPEATASTIELRAALLRETCALMGLANVRLDDRHALIDGHFGQYSVHLGSAVAHQQPGGMLFIVPVHSQHRGRMFLPFADDDPKTAEVLSKVLLLARDQEIKDPNILNAIRG